MSKLIHVRLTDEQFRIMKDAGQGYSDYIRCAVDMYQGSNALVKRYNVIHFLENCINSLENEINMIQNEQEVIQNRYKTNEICINNDTISPNNVSNVIQKEGENVSNMIQNEQEVIQKQSTPLQQKTQKMIKQDGKTIQNILLNPLNMETIPEVTLKLLTKKYTLTKSYIETFIMENKQLFMEGLFEDIQC